MSGLLTLWLAARPDLLIRWLCRQYDEALWDAMAASFPPRFG